MSWPRVKLDKLVTILSGYAFKSANFNDSQGLPLVRIRDVVRGRSETYFDGDYSEDFVINDGDLLIGMDGDFNREKWRGGKALLNQRVCKITADGVKLHQQYLYHFLPDALLRIHAATPSVTVKHLSVKKIRDIEIPLPPLTEQKRIAAILGKADALRRKRKQTIDLADQFLRSVFLEMFGDPVTNPKGWDEIPLGSLLNSIDSGSSPKCDSRPAEDGEWAVLKLGAVTTCQFIPSENKAMFPGGAPRKEYEVQPGDLLFTRKNTHVLVAACALVEETPEKLLLPDLIFRLRTKEKLISKAYLWAVMTHAGKRKDIQGLASGAAGSMPNISKANLKTVLIPVPPLELQRQFEGTYRQLLKLKNKVSASIDHFGDVNGSLSVDAFRGRL